MSKLRGVIYKKIENGGENVSRTKINYLMDLILTILFFVVAGTGLFMYFFMPSGIPRGRYIVYMGLTKATWIWIHSRIGILIAIFVVIHIILHWQWIVYTTRRFFTGGEKNAVCEGSTVTDEDL
jgi:hypothetical protein